MSSSMVTYTSISSDSDLPPWGFHLISDVEPQLLEAVPQSPEQAPPSPDYVPGPEHSEYLAPSDDEITVEDQLLPVDASPTTLSPGYVVDSDPLEEDPEEEESFEDDDEEEEHLAPTDSTLPAIDSVPSAEETEPFETDESADTPPPPRPPQTIVPFPQTRLRRAWIYVLPHTPPSPSAKARIAEYVAIPTPLSPPPSPLSPLSSPLPQIPSPPLPLPSLPLLLPSTAHRTDILEAEMPPQKRVCFTAPTRRFEVGESSTAATARQPGHTLARRVDYGFIDTLDASIRAFESRVGTIVEEVNERVTDLATTQRQDVHELYVCHEDAQDDRALLRAQISLLTRERQYFFSMSLSYEQEAIYARQAWGHSEERSQVLKAHTRTLEAQVGTLQTQHGRMEWQRQEAGDMVTSAFGRIHALEARDPAHPDGLEDAISSF
ncbi:hypothetical protein Tco_0256751 [Tanacetum coccineum]